MTRPSEGAGTGTGDAALPDHIRALEFRRTRALVAKDLALAMQLHAPDYQLVTPAGRTLDRTQYLADIACGALDYVRWDMGEMRVRAAADMAIVRYTAVLAFPSGVVLPCWHTDHYERRGGDWLAVWSQATVIK